MSALPREVPGHERRLRLVTEGQPVAAASWKFVVRGALTAMVLGAVAVVALVISTTGG